MAGSPQSNSTWGHTRPLLSLGGLDILNTVLWQPGLDTPMCPWLSGCSYNTEQDGGTG